MNGISAIARNIRQSPRKVRLLASLIRGLEVSDAFAQLSYTAKAARQPIEKLLRSAVANAENNFQKSRTHLFVQEIRVDEAAVLRRWRPRAFGRAAPIRKAACHIVIRLGERAGVSADVTNTVSLPRGTSTEHDEQKSFSHTTDDHEPAQSASAPPKDSVDTSRTGRAERIHHADAKEKKFKGFMKKIIQRKTG
ncbi:50S ribosomal protein L22 [Candidatus Uhrbacteria bacterium]|nr:50S ribosomal protein L22 [Candidatus Uhrbacteria bacterium]